LGDQLAEFFTSANDLAQWVKEQDGPDKASNILVTLVGDNQQDIVETCSGIYNGDENAAKVLFSVLGKHGLIGFNENREANMSNKDKIKKEAQTMRSGLYNNMPLRVCPKLPYSKGKRLISTWNCREHCLDSLAIDDDPTKTYCLETMWRRHVMDKFAREFKNDDGEWVGGYINERFHRFPDAGTPANPDVDRFQGNNIQLAHGERTRKPREHQYSMEARLEAERGAEPVFHEAKKNGTIIKLADKSGGAEDKGKEIDDQIFEMFSDMIEMKESGLETEDIVIKCAEHYNVNLHEATKIYHGAERQMSRYDGKLYAYTAPKMTKVASTEEDADLKKKVTAQEHDYKPKVVPLPLEGVLQVDNTRKVTLAPNTVLIPAIGAENVYLLAQVPDPTLVNLEFVNQFIMLDQQSSDLLKDQEFNAEVDLNKDQVSLEGLEDASGGQIDLDEAAEALTQDPQATMNFIDQQNDKIGPMNQSTPEPVEISTATDENFDIVKLATDEEIREIQEQFRNTPHDPNKPIILHNAIDIGKNENKTV